MVASFAIRSAAARVEAPSYCVGGTTLTPEPGLANAFETALERGWKVYRFTGPDGSTGYVTGPAPPTTIYLGGSPFTPSDSAEVALSRGPCQNATVPPDKQKPNPKLKPAKTATITVGGTVSCASHAVVGVWVQSTGGGSGWAAWKPGKKNTQLASYNAKIVRTTLPTTLSLHIGCGGSAKSWWSDNWTSSKRLSGSTGNLDAVCAEGASKPAKGANKRCAWGIPAAALGGRAAAWAKAQIGRTNANAKQRALMRKYGIDWAAKGDGPPGEWSGDCYRFASLAWMEQGARLKKGATAYGAAAFYRRKGKLETKGTPPAGAIIFYSGVLVGKTDLGHAAISLGNGDAVSTKGLDGDRAKIRKHGYKLTGLTYLGYVINPG